MYCWNFWRSLEVYPPEAASGCGRAQMQAISQYGSCWDWVGWPMRGRRRIKGDGSKRLRWVFLELPVDMSSCKCNNDWLNVRTFGLVWVMKGPKERCNGEMVWGVTPQPRRCSIKGRKQGKIISLCTKLWAKLLLLHERGQLNLLCRLALPHRRPPWYETSVEWLICDDSSARPSHCSTA